MDCCRSCGAELAPMKGPGRRKLYCSETCRGRQYRASGYIAPSRRRTCGSCGKLVQSTKTSAVVIVCRGCRKAQSPRRSHWPSGCFDCGRAKPSPRHKYCEPCRTKRRNKPNNSPKLATATQRGYGTEHTKARRVYLAKHRPGDPCSRCGQPMLDPVELLDLDHTDDRTGYLGLAHRACNRATAGTAKGLVTKVCDGCGVPFDTRDHSRHYCTRACYRQAVGRGAA